nr:hypothetical protein [Candidatus Electrothrix aestuarii]
MKYEIEKTNIFDSWLNSLKDKTAVNRILARLYRVEHGNFGDVKSVGQNLFELRFFFRLRLSCLLHNKREKDCPAALWR